MNLKMITCHAILLVASLPCRKRGKPVGTHKKFSLLNCKLELYFKNPFGLDGQMALIFTVSMMALASLAAGSMFFMKYIIGSEHDEKDVNLGIQLSVRNYVTRTLEKSLKEDKGTGCDILKTEYFPKEVLRFNDKYPPIVCNGKDWVKCYLSTCKIDESILDSVKRIQCIYRDILYQNDEIHTFGPPTVLNGNRKYQLSKSDHVEIKCEATAEIVKGLAAPRSWGGHAAGFRPMSVKTPPPGRERTYNVLILGIHSTSRDQFIREMPKTYPYIKNELGATFLNGYNIVGDGTAGALFPILTGKTELEHPDWRKKILNTDSVDSTSFIFHKLKEDGYRTAFFEETSQGGDTFQRRFHGFRRQPADHYLRDFFLEVINQEQKFGTKNNPYCIGDTPQYQVMLNLTDQFFKQDGKKYACSFISDITHDSNRISYTDNSFVEFFKGLKQRGVLKNTLVIIMSDHGPRYGNLRQTLQGKLEERLPLMAIRLPDEMRTQRPDAQQALEMNADVLTTPHDIYATVLDALDMKQDWNKYKVKGADLLRGLTLLKLIPKTRSCSEAGIERHWCACLRWQEVDAKDPMFERTSQALLQQMNNITEVVRSQCALKNLGSIIWVKKKVPHKKVLQFQDTFDDDGYLGIFEKKKPKIDLEIYYVKIAAFPGNRIYEATVLHDLWTGNLLVEPQMISRVNAYEKESKCISDIYPDISPYCYCKTTEPLLKLGFFDKILSNFIHTH